MTSAKPNALTRIAPWVLFGAVLVACIALVVRSNWIRAERVRFVSNLNEWSVDTPSVNPSSPTGYEGGLRRAIVPVHNNESYQWIEQTQQMFSRKEWRIRQVNYENAPSGREVHAASPYRWWLGLIAKLDQIQSGRPIGLAVEHAAVWADPTLHLVLLVGVAVLAAWCFGPWTAALLSIGIAALFPFAGGFIPGAPSLAPALEASILGSLLILQAGVLTPQSESRRRWFFLAGAAMGFVLWISVPHAIVLISAVAFSAAVSALFGWKKTGEKGTGPKSDGNPGADAVFPWRAWSYGGALMSLLGYAAEYLPGAFTLRLEVNHPVYAVSWLGIGELLHQLANALSAQKASKTKAMVLTTLALIATGVAPVLIWRARSHVFSSAGISELRLNMLTGISAQNLPSWIGREGARGAALFTLLPLLIALVAFVVIPWIRGVKLRSSIMLCLGPVVAFSILAWSRLWWWNLVDCALLALLVPLSLAAFDLLRHVVIRSLVLVATAALLGIGLSLNCARKVEAEAASLNDSEGDSYIERDLAHWLAEHYSPESTIVLCPPNLTTTMTFHGGLRGLGTFNWENDQGNTAAVRIVSASSLDEAEALINARGITHIVIPSWDSALDDYASLGLRASTDSRRFAGSFIGLLHQWDLPLWLRPIPYPLPPNAGVERNVVILEVVEEQEPVVALSRQAEYFVEMQQLDRAESTLATLRQYPGDLSALTAIAYVEAGRGDNAAAAATVGKMLPFVSRQARRAMPFDRRLSLAVLLAQQKQNALAEEQVQRLIAEANEAKLRSVTALSLYRFNLLLKRYNLHLADPKMDQFSRQLLRPDLRARL